MRKSLVVFEGADSSGKTTLARALGADHTFHAGPFVGWVEEAHAAMLEAARRRDGLVAFDRHWISETIYGPAFRGAAAYGDGVVERFDREIRERGVYVLCVPSDVAGHERRFAREHAAKRELFATVAEVADRYAKLAHGYIFERGEGYLSRYVRHGDFAERDCLVYDLDTDGKDPAKFAVKIRKALG